MKKPAGFPTGWILRFGKYDYQHVHRKCQTGTDKQQMTDSIGMFELLHFHILHLSGIVPDKTYCKYYDEADHVECHTGKYDAKYSDGEWGHDTAVVDVLRGGGLFGSHVYHYTGLSTYSTFIYVLLVNC